MPITNNSNLIADSQREVTRAASAWIAQMMARVRRLRAAWAARRERARELDDLYRLSDRELWDVGLSRSDFPAIEKGVYRRK